MTCIDGIDAADFDSGILDPADDPSPPTPRFDISDGVFFDLGVGNRYVQFEVTISPIDYVNSISVLFSTANGTALAGTHYTARTNVLMTFAAGEGVKADTVGVLTPAGAAGDKTFTINLSSPSGGTIGDGTGVNVIHYGIGSGSGGGTTEPPPSTDPATWASYTGWPRSMAYIYNQFSSCPTADCPYRCGGCKYKSACTAFCGAAVTSCHRYRDQGDKKCYDAKDLWADVGGPACDCTTCTGMYSGTIRDRMVNNGVLLGGTVSTVRRMLSWSQISALDTTSLIAKLKRSIAANGCAWIDSIWYSNWNSSGSGSWPNFIMPSHGNDTSITGHSWVAVGWNNNVGGTGKGCFLMQSSHGTGWADSGRAWLPYSYLRLAGTKPNPWWRYYAVVPRPGG